MALIKKERSLLTKTARFVDDGQSNPQGWTLTTSEVLGSNAVKQTSQTVSGTDPSGVPHTATVSHIRGKRLLTVYIKLKKGDNEWNTWTGIVELKATDPKFNILKLSEQFEKHKNSCLLLGVSENFVRAVWGRTYKDRAKAIKDIFPNKNVEKKEIPKDKDLFS